MSMSSKRYFALALLLLSCISHASAQPRLDSDETDLAPPGRLVDVGGYQLHINCLGQSGPVVILEAGVGGFSLEWLRVQEALASEAVVCAYDRAGYGWSDMGPLPRTTKRISHELRTLLQTAELPGPYVLVGHSFGGYVAQYYARSYSDEVAAVVLIDASHPEQLHRLARAESNSYLGELRLPERRQYMLSKPVIHPNFPVHYSEAAMHMLSSWKSSLTQREELTNMGFSGAQVLGAGPFPELPLVVLTRGLRVWPHTGDGDAMEANWMELQDELSQLSPQVVHLIAERAGHVIHLDQPGVVVTALRHLIAQLDEAPSSIAQRMPAHAAGEDQCHAPEFMADPTC
jgi:pimeloyl-ACP methyl ester carboxylesterase